MANFMTSTNRATRNATTAAAIAAIALFTTGCSGLVDKAVEKAVEEGIEAAVEADSGEEFELDLDLGEGSANFEVDGAEGSFGVNLDRPDWLDDDYDLPDGFSIAQQLNNEEEGTSTIAGLVQDKTIVEIHTQQIETIEAMGFDVAEPFQALGTETLIAAHSDGRAMEFLMFGQDGTVTFTVLFHEAGSQGAEGAVARIEELESQA